MLFIPVFLLLSGACFLFFSMFSVCRGCRSGPLSPSPVLLPGLALGYPSQEFNSGPGTSRGTGHRRQEVRTLESCNCEFLLSLIFGKVYISEYRRTIISIQRFSFIKIQLPLLLWLAVIDLMTYIYILSSPCTQSHRANTMCVNMCLIVPI